MGLNPRAPRLIGDVVERDGQRRAEEEEEEEEVGRRDGTVPVGGGAGVR